MNSNVLFSKKSSEALIQYFSFFAGLLDKLPIALYYSRKTKASWVIDFVSDGITRLLGYTSSDVVGEIGFNALTLELDLYERIPLRSTGKTNEYSYLSTFLTKNNRHKKLIDKGLYLFDSSGNLKGATGILMDFSLEPGFDMLEYMPSATRPAKAQSSCLDEIVGHSPAMKKVIERIIKVAGTREHVLIEGESGTGKELTARAIHELSGSGGRPFIAINCGAISEQLIESEFFGHVKGAFSGASENRQGYLDVVNKGTLFLDEVGEMPINMQIKLLRVLDGYGYTPVGSTKVKNSLFRLICATNRDLNALVQAGMMRLDFYHRIKQLTITLPPLRDRREDVPALMRHFAERYYHDNHLDYQQQQTAELQAVQDKFLLYSWPGNVRELYHAVIKYLSLGEMDFMRQSLAKSSSQPAGTAVQSTAEPGQPDNFQDYERSLLLAALNAAHWDTQAAAQALGLSRRSIQRKIKLYKLR